MKHQLSDTAIRALKPRPKLFKVHDGGGLYLLVHPSNGSKYWRYKYHDEAGKEKSLALGVYPEVPLALARERLRAARAMRAAGIDPMLQKKEFKAHAARAQRTFEMVAREWLPWSAQRKKLAPDTVAKTLALLEGKLFPTLGARAIEQITTAEMLGVLLTEEKRGKLENASRMRQKLGAIFRFAKGRNYIQSNPAPDLVDALAPKKVKHHPGLTDPREVGQLLVDIDSCTGQPATIAALKLCPYVFVRPGELRKAQWHEIDFERAQWRMKAQRMKMEEQHIVPLSRQALAILRDIQSITGEGLYIFPGIGPKVIPLSEGTLKLALHRLGYKDRQSWHGFRTTASTLLNELEYSADWVEVQLAHTPKDKVRGDYNKARRLVSRTQMMQEWADYLDALRASALPILPKHTSLSANSRGISALTGRAQPD